MYQQLIDTAVENKFYIKNGYISRAETCYFLDIDQLNKQGNLATTNIQDSRIYSKTAK